MKPFLYGILAGLMVMAGCREEKPAELQFNFVTEIWCAEKGEPCIYLTFKRDSEYVTDHIESMYGENFTLVKRQYCLKAEECPK